MIQIFKEVITTTLKLIFAQSLKKEKFPEIWKAANVVSAQKKRRSVSSKTLSSYQLTSYFW